MSDYPFFVQELVGTRVEQYYLFDGGGPCLTVWVRGWDLPRTYAFREERHRADFIQQVVLPCMEAADE